MASKSLLGSPAITFAIVQKKVVTALRNGSFSAVARNNINVKNLLLTGAVTVPALIQILSGCSSENWSHSPHHDDPLVTVHVLTPVGWYVKFYFVDPDTVFISVHR